MSGFLEIEEFDQIKEKWVLTITVPAHSINQLKKITENVIIRGYEYDSMKIYKSGAFILVKTFKNPRPSKYRLNKN